MTQPPVKEMLNVKEASEIANVTIGHFRELIRLKKINAIKVGKEWRVSREELNNYLGVKTDIKSFERELYIKELEAENMQLKLKLNLAQTNISNILSLIGN